MTIFTTPFITPFLRILSRFILWVTWWKLENKIPSSVKKCVIIAAPHTSNWDMPIMLMVALSLKLPVHFLAKHTLFSFPFGGLMKWLGGIPVDRARSQNMVKQSVLNIKNSLSCFYLAISPEGTRKKVETWKTGFYEIALQAEVPIALAFMDYKEKRSGVSAMFIPKGDIAIDLPKIQFFYKQYQGKNPDQF